MLSYYFELDIQFMFRLSWSLGRTPFMVGLSLVEFKHKGREHILFVTCLSIFFKWFNAFWFPFCKSVNQTSTIWCTSMNACPSPCVRKSPAPSSPSPSGNHNSPSAPNHPPSLKVLFYCVITLLCWILVSDWSIKAFYGLLFLNKRPLLCYF